MAFPLGGAMPINEFLTAHKPELFLNDLKIALRSLRRSKGLAIRYNGSSLARFSRSFAI
jgi:hypothetical protein